MLSEENLFDILIKTGIIKQVEDDVSDFEKEIAEQIEFTKYRDYPLGDSFCIDYVESNLDENFVKELFYKKVADNIKDISCCEKEIFNGYNDKEICHLLDIYCHVDIIMDMAYSHSQEEDSDRRLGIYGV